ncbi:MAG TPA: dihydrodipicolinate reductase [bacterium]|nr:dihydrodipicolinate reductase [bacterium]
MSGESISRVVVLGLGPIGRAVALEILRDPTMKLVGAVDPLPDLAGRDLSEVLGVSGPRGVQVSSAIAFLKGVRFDIAVHMAGSRFLDVAPLLADLVSRQAHVVSTSEELIAAAVRWPAEAAALDQLARENGVAVLPAGVNPGFVMDLLPSGIANACVTVRSIQVTRHVDTSKRRAALQAKTGAGLTRTEFVRRARAGTIGHVGLRDSLLFLLDHLPLQAEASEETIRPILATKAIGKGKSRIEKGQVAGVHQRVVARMPGTRKTVAVYDLKMARDLKNPHDEIRIDGDPPVHVRIEGGIHGDRATVGMVLSTIRAIREARPGLGR